MVGKCIFCKDINILVEVLIRFYLKYLIELFRVKNEFLYCFLGN